MDRRVKPGGDEEGEAAVRLVSLSSLSWGEVKIATGLTSE
jgi:hypothetical protein